MVKKEKSAGQLQTDERLRTAASLISGPGIRFRKDGKAAETEERAGKTGMDGKEPADGAVFRFIRKSPDVPLPMPLSRFRMYLWKARVFL